MAKIPQSLNDINEQWLLTALKEQNSSGQNVEILSLEHVKEKNGFLSGVAQASARINGKLAHLFIKIITEPDDPFTFWFQGNNFDQVEINFYKENLLALSQFEKLHCSAQNSKLEQMVPR